MKFRLPIALLALVAATHAAEGEKYYRYTKGLYTSTGTTRYLNRTEIGMYYNDLNRPDSSKPETVVFGGPERINAAYDYPFDGGGTVALKVGEPASLPFFAISEAPITTDRVLIVREGTLLLDGAYIQNHTKLDDNVSNLLIGGGLCKEGNESVLKGAKMVLDNGAIYEQKAEFVGNATSAIAIGSGDGKGTVTLCNNSTMHTDYFIFAGYRKIEGGYVSWSERNGSGDAMGIRYADDTIDGYNDRDEISIESGSTMSAGVSLQFGNVDVTITGEGSTLCDNTLGKAAEQHESYFGHGKDCQTTIEVKDGGKLELNGNAYAATSEGSSVKITVSGEKSGIDVAGTLYLGAEDAEIAEATLSIDGSTYNGSGIQAYAKGAIDNKGTINADVVLSGGSYAGTESSVFGGSSFTAQEGATVKDLTMTTGTMNISGTVTFNNVKLGTPATTFAIATAGSTPLTLNITQGAFIEGQGVYIAPTTIVNVLLNGDYKEGDVLFTMADATAAEELEGDTVYFVNKNGAPFGLSTMTANAGVVTAGTPGPTGTTLNLSSNQNSFYNAVKAAVTAGSVEPALVALAICQNEAEAKAAIDAMSGHEYATAMSSQIEGNLGHLRRLRGSMGKGTALGSYVATPGNAATLDEKGNEVQAATPAVTDIRNWRVGVSAFHEETELDGDSSGDGYDRSETGAMLTAEYYVNKDVTLGGAISYGRTKLSTDGAKSRHEDNTRFDVYALYGKKRWSFATSLGMGMHEHELLGGDVDGYSINFLQDAAYTVLSREKDNVQVFGTIESSWNEIDSCSDGMISADSQDAWATDVTVGLRYNRALPALGNAPAGVFTVQAGVTASIGDIKSNADMDINGFGYTQKSATRDRWGWNLGAGVDVPVRTNVSVYGAAEAVLRGDSNSVDGQIGVKVSF